MKRLLVLFFICWCIWGLGTTAQALTVDANSIEIVTVDPNASIEAYKGGFAFSGNDVIWSDWRDSNGIPAIMGSNVFEAGHPERTLIFDPNYFSAWGLRKDGNKAIYFSMNMQEYTVLRYIEDTTASEPNVFDVVVSNQSFYNADISGNWIAYTGQDTESEGPALFAVDVNNPSAPLTYQILHDPNGGWWSSVTIDGTYIAFFTETGQSPYSTSIKVANIADPNNPVITSFDVPLDCYGWSGYLYGFDSSGEWLVCSGQFGRVSGIHAIMNYTDTDVNNWEVKTIYKQTNDGCSNVEAGEPSIDAPYVVWTVNSWVHPHAVQDSPETTVEEPSANFIMGAYLLNSGNITTSQLFSSPNNLGAVEVSGEQIVWSTEPIYSLENDEERALLWTGTLKTKCGDWGYPAGDINKDCKVDFIDFALMATSWLECTEPGNPNCVYGTNF